MSILARIGKIFDHINTLMVIVCAILVVGLTFIVGADITLRYLFNKPLGWVKEVSEYTLVGLGFLAAAWILKDDAHVKMDLILTKVEPSNPDHDEPHNLGHQHDSRRHHHVVQL